MEFNSGCEPVSVLGYRLEDRMLNKTTLSMDPEVEKAVRKHYLPLTLLRVPQIISASQGPLGLHPHCLPTHSVHLKCDGPKEHQRGLAHRAHDSQCKFSGSAGGGPGCLQ